MMVPGYSECVSNANAEVTYLQHLTALAFSEDSASDKKVKEEEPLKSNE